MKQKNILWAGLVIFVFVITFTLVLRLNFTAREDNVLPDKKYHSDINKDEPAIFNDEDLLYGYVQKFGPKATTQYLNKLSLELGDCHNTAHRAGRYAYDIYKEEAFKLCSSECHSGCYHGATEAYFKDNGTADLAGNLNLLCGSGLNEFFSHQCIHGIGHGLMAWTDYDLPEALKNCNLLNQRQDSCWTGVFMENIVGGLAQSDIVDKGGDFSHFTKYLNDDPHYPCNIVEEKYKWSCYFLQTSRMVQLFGPDFKKITQTCLEVPDPYQESCFDSMGRDIGGTWPHNARKAIAACSFAPKGLERIICLTGAVQDALWDPTGQNDALTFCRLLDRKAEKDACYDTIFTRAKEIFTSASDLKNFCQKAELQYQNTCLATVSMVNK